MVESDSLAQGQRWGNIHAEVKTQTERFTEMQQTVGRRLTCGKSAIHGLGAFTKLPHQAGEPSANLADCSCMSLCHRLFTTTASQDLNLKDDKVHLFGGGGDWLDGCSGCVWRWMILTAHGPEH